MDLKHAGDGVHPQGELVLGRRPATYDRFDVNSGKRTKVVFRPHPNVVSDSYDSKKIPLITRRPPLVGYRNTHFQGLVATDDGSCRRLHH